MKKYILTIFITFFSLSINAQNMQIDSLYITNSVSSTILGVTIVVKKASGFFYVGSDYSVDDGEIELRLCYYSSVEDSETSISKKLYLQINDPSHYNLNVSVFESQSNTSCDYFEKKDSASLSFNFPFADTGYLALNSNPVIPTINLYPNPVQNKLNINSNGLNVDDLKIYDVFGKLVFDKAKPAEQIDLSELENGIYFVVLRIEQGIVKEKIIVNR